MLSANGLYGHIRNNALKSAALLAGFVVLMAVFWFAWCLIYVSVVEHVFPTRELNRAAFEVKLAALFVKAWQLSLERWWVPLVCAASWFTIAGLLHAEMIRLATGAKPVTRREAPKLYNTVENLAMAAGIPVPRIEIMRSSALNAYAAGLTPASSVVVVTRGLIETLDQAELEAVIAHEIAHIRNHDVRLMVVATVFAGGLTMVGDAVGRLVSGEGTSGGGSSGDMLDVLGRSSGGDSDDRDGLAPVAVAIGIAIVFLALTHLFALLIKFAISRSREYMADAGAVELTKHPEALVSALRKIEGRDAIPGVKGNVRAMMISASAEGMFSTHPTTASRIEALERFAGTCRAARPIRTNTSSDTVGAARAPVASVGFGKRRVAPAG
jgi:heat shock protein HtpX